MAKSTTKKIIIILGIMLIAIFIKNIDSDAATVATYQAGDNVTAVLDDQGTLTISGTGDMANYRNSDTIPWYYVGSTIKRVVIEQGVTSIGDHAFYCCKSLTTIEIPSSVTSIGYGAFNNCASLTEIEIPSSVTSIGKEAFYYCTSLTTIEIPSSVTSIGDDAFYYCTSLTTIEIQEGVTSIGKCAFADCGGVSLTSITIPNSVTSIGSFAFSGTKTIKYVEMNETGEYSVELPEIIQRTMQEGDILYTDVNPTLTNCTISDDKKTLNFSKKPEENKEISVKINDGALVKLNFKIVVLETWDVSKNQDGSVLAKLTEDGTLTISGTGDIANYGWFEAPWYSIKDNIKRVVIEQGVTSIGGCAFYRCTSLTTIEIQSSVTSIGKEAFYYCRSLTEIEIPSSVISIGDYAFNYCTSLTTIEIPSSVTSIGDYTFNYCASLTEIKVNENNSQYSSENGVLFNKEKTEIIRYPNGKSDTSYTIPSSVTSIGKKAFYECRSLTEIEIPSSVTSIVRSAFYNCTNLTEIKVNENNSQYSSENGVLFNKEKTEIICYPNGKNDTSYTIPSSVTSIGEGAFYECERLTIIEIPDGVTSIEEMAFYACIRLTTIEIPSSVTSIGGWGVFYNCISLTIIEIPEGVTRIGASAFCGCRSLTTMKIPSSVTRIGASAFFEDKKAIIVTEKGNYADTYAQENKINRLTYSTMNWTNQNVDIELNGEKIYTFEDNGEYEFQYKYTDSNSNEQTETAKAEVTWIVTNLGDINNDGNIDVTDLILLKRHIVAGNRTEWILIGQGENSADINGDGNVDVTDLLLLKRHIVAGNKEEWKIKTHVTSST